MLGSGDKAGKIKQKKTSFCITLLLRPNTKLGRKKHETGGERCVRLDPERELREGEGKRGGECLKEECEGGQLSSE